VRVSRGESGIVAAAVGGREANRAREKRRQDALRNSGQAGATDSGMRVACGRLVRNRDFHSHSWARAPFWK
jgi:hypothetical protein